MFCISFFGGLDQDNNKELNLLYGGSFMDLTHEQAWIRLDKIHINRETWGFDLESEGEIEIEYDCLNAYKENGKVKETANELHLDDVMVLYVLQTFTEFTGAPKKEWLHYTPPPQPVEGVQMVVDTHQEVLIERQPYEDPLPLPRTAAKHAY
jgi:hypothetical protein